MYIYTFGSLTHAYYDHISTHVVHSGLINCSDLLDEVEYRVATHYWYTPECSYTKQNDIESICQKEKLIRIEISRN